MQSATGIRTWAITNGSEQCLTVRSAWVSARTEGSAGLLHGGHQPPPQPLALMHRSHSAAAADQQRYHLHSHDLHTLPVSVVSAADPLPQRTPDLILWQQNARLERPHTASRRQPRAISRFAVPPRD